MGELENKYLGGSFAGYSEWFTIGHSPTALSAHVAPKEDTQISPSLDMLIQSKIVGSFLPQFDVLDKRISVIEEVMGREKLNKNIAIKHIRSSRLVLSEPLYINIDYNDREEIYIASSADLNIWGHGETEQEAIDSLCEDVRSLYRDLKRDRKNLGGDLEMRWEFLRDIVKEKK